MARPRDAQAPPSTAMVAAALQEIGALLALDPAQHFRARAYERGAGVVAVLPDLDALVRTGRLRTVPGIGPGLARTIEALVRTGRAEVLDRLREQHPRAVAALAPVLSPARARAVHAALGVETLAALREACEAGQVRTVRGFGEKSERRLLERIAALAERRDAVTLAAAASQGERLRAHLAGHPAAGAVELAGMLRRRIETIERLDLVVASTAPPDLRAHAEAFPGAVAVAPVDEERFVVHQAGALDAHVRVVPAAAFPAAWIDATGAPAHLSALHERAAGLGLALDDRRLRRGGRPLAVADEEALYERLGLPCIPPELRAGTGEVEAAVAGALPADLLRLEDVQGVVHCHTTYSDGKNTIEEMARAAEALGLRYLTITDHSATAHYAGGLDVARLRRQWDEIARVQERVAIRLLRGTESDILRDGALDFPDAVLRELEVVIASIHERHHMDAAQMTRRLVRAMQHPVRKIWGHALGRYVLARPPVACRLDEVLDAAAASGTLIEVNGDPRRLDLAPVHLPEARRRGLRFVVSADAHSTAAIANLRWAVDMARRGWLRRRDVVNTLGTDAFAAAVRPAG